MALDWLFGKDKTTVLPKNAGVDRALTGVAGRQAGYGSIFDRSVLDTQGAVDRATAGLTTLQPRSLAQFGQVSNRVAGFDPQATYRSIFDTNLARADQVARTMAGVGSAQDKLMRARLGYAGLPAGSYVTLLNTDRVARNMAPIYQSVFNNTGSDLVNLGNLTYAQPGALSAAVQGAEGVLTRPVPLYSVPGQLAAQYMTAEGGQMGTLAQAAANNFAGLDVQRDHGFFDVVNGLTDSVGNLVGVAGQAAGVAGGVGMLGGADGLMGGLMGGGRDQGGNPRMTPQQQYVLEMLRAQPQYQYGPMYQPQYVSPLFFGLPGQGWGRQSIYGSPGSPGYRRLQDLYAEGY